jgi:hypothetical protein
VVAVLSRMRKLIREADPDAIEEWKWMGTPVWSHDGIICTGESYKTVVKLTFAKGVSLKDPARLFNSSLDGNTRRAIDIHEGERVARVDNPAGAAMCVARPAGLEPAAPSLEGSCSIQLSYGRVGHIVPKCRTRQAPRPGAA